ncbi:glycinin G4 [Cajanus cajan]|uniref:glycinin G4 n=1 Tax=Cajanus cajan TaxID=3821 RepID=UPI00098DD4A6|nr:glycinin G4 [Cajanus cajan]
MARPFILSLSMLFLASACFAFSFSTFNFNKCQLDSLNALEPDQRVESEGGVIETYNSQHPELQCAGVTVSKHTLYRNGLHLPSYSPYPKLIHVIQGQGAFGLAVPGCPETFEEPAEGSSRKGRQQHVQDSHQKIRQFTQGDVILIPPGIPYWTFNTGDEPLIAVSLLYTSSIHNNLDQSPRVFYLGGNPDIENPETTKEQPQQQKRGGGRKQQQEEEEEEAGSVLSGFSKHFLAQSFNIDEDLAEKLRSPEDDRKQIVKVEGGLSIISPMGQEQQQQEEEKEDEDEDEPRSRCGRSHQGKHSHEEGEEKEEEEEEPHSPCPRRPSHGKHKVEEEEEKEEEGPEHKSRERRWKKKIQPAKPEEGGEEKEEEEEEEEYETKHSRRKEHGNGIEESICTVKLHESISRPSRADFYNPKAGRISTLNSATFPALTPFGLSAQYVVLYKNGIYAPHWNQNANSVIYVIRGQGKVRVVNNTGDAVFDRVLKRGQLLVVPQNFVVAEQASEEGFEYVVFKTNEMATTTHMKQVFRAIPAEVLANTYNLRQSQVRELKYLGNQGPLVNPDSQ